MKGIVLAGGSGTRLYPNLGTRGIDGVFPQWWTHRKLTKIGSTSGFSATLV